MREARKARRVAARLHLQPGYVAVSLVVMGGVTILVIDNSAPPRVILVNKNDSN